MKDVVFSLQTQNKIGRWYVDNGCSKNMTKDKRIFMNLNNNKERIIVLWKRTQSVLEPKRKWHKMFYLLKT